MAQYESDDSYQADNPENSGDENEFSEELKDVSQLFIFRSRKCLD